MSEFQAALLLDRLAHLDAENAHRAARAATLRDLMDGMPGVTMLSTPPEVTSQTYYNLVLRFDLDHFAGHSIDIIALALAEELNTGIYPLYKPMNRHPLYQPLKAPRGGLSDQEWQRRDSARFAIPTAERTRGSCLTLTHPVLLDDDASMKDIARAIEKVQALAADLREVIVDAPAQQAF